MKRREVYRLIDGERDYQQARGQPDEHDLCEWLRIMNYYTTGAFDVGDDTLDEVERLHEIRKIVAVGIAALEQHGCSPREGYGGTVREGQQAQLPSVPSEVLEAIDELRDLAAEAIPYAGEYFDDKWQLSERFEQAAPIVDKWQQDAQPSEQQAQLPDDVREALQLLVNVVRDLPNISPKTILGRAAALETAQKWLEDAQPSEQEGQDGTLTGQA